MHHIIAKIVAHKLIVVALASMAADGLSTAEFQSRTRYLPPAGVIYLGTDGLFHKSPGPQRDLLMGNPGNLQIALEVPASTIGTLFARRRFPKAASTALLGETAFHFAGTALNLVNMPHAWTRPVCELGQPGCVGTPVIAGVKDQTFQIGNYRQAR
jgi:hypothetical protein